MPGAAEAATAWVDLTPESRSQEANWVTWGPDDSRFYFFTGERPQTAAVWAYDTDSRSGHELARTGFFPTDSPAVSPDGATIFLFGYRINDHGETIDGAPFILALDTTTGATRGTLPLPGVSPGQRKVERAGGADYASDQPGFAVSPDGTKAYIAHADSDAITVVDLTAMRVEKTVAVSRGRSKLERVREAVTGLLVTTAHAKGGPSSRRVAVVTGDGRWLFVAGQEQPCDLAANRCDYRPSGLRVIDTRSMKVVLTEDEVGSLTLAPGGKFVVGTGVRWVLDAKGEFERHTGPGALIFDAQEPALLAKLGPEAGYQQVSVDGSGRYAHLLSFERDDSRPCMRSCERLTVINLEQRKIITIRYLAAVVVSLFGAARQNQ